jgi:hypothetical protein
LKSRATPRFWVAYGALPESVQEHARKAYRLFRENPAHPSLQFKKVSERGPVYAARVTLDYRTLGVLTGGEVVWFWIGSHAAYDRLLREM